MLAERAAKAAHQASARAPDAQADEEQPEPERGHEGEPEAGPGLRARGDPGTGLAAGQHDADARRDDADDLQRGRALAAGDPDQHGHGDAGGRDRRHDAHRADGQAAIEAGQRDQTGHAAPERGQQAVQRGRGHAPHGQQQPDPDQARRPG